ncbi:MAG: HAMP domain-containing histidine kinase [Deltaproteobacteria bacterium]|nr:HAMP domain-containing histidine kinase [Deltaproteobacteria bacterium]
MKRLRLFILIFCVSLSVPLAYFVLRTYRGLEQEEVAELRYFAETLFDEMEEELGSLILKEESRAIDEYRHNYIPSGQISGAEGISTSPLSRPPRKTYILGYLQNNPDGSFHTPLVESEERVPQDQIPLVAQLKDVNELFNTKRTLVPESVEAEPTELPVEVEKEEAQGFAGKYLDLSRSKKQKVYLGQEEKRVEEITADKAYRLAQRGDQKVLAEGAQEAWPRADEDMALDAIDRRSRDFNEEKGFFAGEVRQAAPSSVLQSAPPPADAERLQVEIDPMQSVFISDSQVFIFRRIVINNEVYRQGFVLVVKEFLRHLAGEYFVNQPMAGFANLRLKVMDQGRELTAVQAGVVAGDPRFSLDRAFPRPFSFLRAVLTCEEIPRSAGRRTLNIMMVVLAAIILMGLFAIYQSARAVVDLSERRSGFVSSVTHEVKTPLTNIRMYIEMLEQGIARDPEREQEYFRIVGSESARLSRLINNVLEFSKLEKKQRHVDLQEGTFEEVIREVNDVMREKLRQEGFTLKVEWEEIRLFKYDREIMIQVLINLIENSMKFGKASSVREITLRVWPEDDSTKISVSDTGPGIPRHALNKVFDDFYRVDSSLTRTTRGTGIGLALVKRFIHAMRGSVTASNNDGPGCTITISLPS